MSMWPDEVTADIDVDLSDIDIDSDDRTALLPIHAKLVHAATQTEPLGADAWVQTEQATEASKVKTHADMQRCVCVCA